MTQTLTPEDRTRLRKWLQHEPLPAVATLAMRLLDAYEALETNHQAALTLLKAAGLIREDA